MKIFYLLWTARAAVLLPRVQAPLFHSHPLRINSIEYTRRLMETTHA